MAKNKDVARTKQNVVSIPDPLYKGEGLVTFL